MQQKSGFPAGECACHERLRIETPVVLNPVENSTRRNISATALVHAVRATSVRVDATHIQDVARPRGGPKRRRDGIIDAMALELRARALGGEIGPSIGRQPRFPDAIDVAVIEEKDRIVGRGARQHVTADPHMDPVVQHRTSVRSSAAPAFDSVSEAIGVRIPLRRVTRRQA